MKKIILSLLLIFTLFDVSFANNPFVLTGKIENVVSGNAVLSYWFLVNDKWEQVKYTSEIKQGLFKFKGSLKEPVNAQLKIGEIMISLFIEPTKMELFITKTNPDRFKLIGSRIQKESDRFTQETIGLENLANKIHEQAVKNYDQIKVTPKTDVNYKKLLVESEFISLQRDSVSALMAKKEIAFIASHPNSFLPVLERTIVRLLSRGSLTVDSARALFDKMSEKVKLSSYGTITNTFIKIEENIVVGKEAPDFNTPDMTGKIIKLYNFREKSYVLLDFWASWCGPCIKGIPHTKELYEKYHDKGLEIIGISCDRSKEEWITAVKKHQISIWHNVLSTQSLERNSQGYVDSENISEKYPTDGIPKYILIDKKGEIIGKWEGYSEENEKDMDKVINNFFR